MRELGYVCLRCHVRLLTGPWTRPGLPTARLSSYSQSYSTTSAKPPQKDGSGQQKKKSVNTKRHSAVRDGVARGAQRGVAPPDGAASLAVFQSIVDKQHEQSSPPGPKKKQTSNILLVKEVAQIKTMLEQEGATVAEAFAFFDKTIYPQLRDAGDATPRIVKNQLAIVLFPKMADEMSRSSYSGPTTVLRITQLMVEFDIVSPVTWGSLIIALADYICRLPTGPEVFDSVQAYETTMTRREALMHDLVDAWQAFGTPTPAPETAESKEAEAPGTEVAIASADATPKDDTEPRLNRKTQQRRRTLPKAFAGLFPHHSPYELVRPSWAALATYALLVNSKNHNQALWQKAHPFLEMMRQPLATSFIPFASPNAPVFESCPQALNSLVRHFLRNLRAKQDTEWKPRAPSAKPRDLADAVHKEIGHAVRTRNPAALDAAWRKFWGKEDAPSAEKLAQLLDMPKIWDYFIHAYMSIRQTQRALDVWNIMVRHGMEPTVKTWTSMIQGCTNARNSHGIKTAWDRLVASGTRLDNHVWTARISGLIISGDVDAGFAALEEMAQIWHEREKPEYAALAVQPSVEPINAAAHWLLRYDKLPIMMNLLLWAAKQGIEPDVYTFNTMLRPLLRQGKTAQARDLLDMMKHLNVNADAATCTILLENALAGIAWLPSKEQVDRVNHVIGEIEAAGFSPNMQNFGKMIYILVEEGGPNSDGAAIKAVLGHIWDRGLDLSSQIYTMLAEYYFTRDPPDAAAVTKLIENRRLRHNTSIDRVFWERVIKGYCQVGEIQNALEVFQKVFASGSTITFSTLYELLFALLEEGENGKAKELVQAARALTDLESEDSDGASVAEAQGKPLRYWKHRFWHLAHRHGLIERELSEALKAAAGARGVDNVVDGCI
ncbi:hypothetical protein B0T14DRAFT_516654 [Immersiella caudata]|uniref:Pentatricopeptide repeat-containing protein n=1 Tax=Immersiella caudata TaxID=314043 RepID=A0AA39WYB4_9PEZI|nr:hypothetical protein B0T14DRAFT_516654 [Immersiella caudata]